MTYQSVKCPLRWVDFGISYVLQVCPIYFWILMCNFTIWCLIFDFRRRLIAYLPPKSRIVLAFIYPPDIFGAVFRLIYEVPSRFEECFNCSALITKKSGWFSQRTSRYTCSLNAMHSVIVEKTRATRTSLIVAKLLYYQPIIKFTCFDDANHLSLSALRARQYLRCRYFFSMRWGHKKRQFLLYPNNNIHSFFDYILLYLSNWIKLKSFAFLCSHLFWISCLINKPLRNLHPSAVLFLNFAL